MYQMKVLVLFFAWMAIACALWPLPASYTVSEDTVILCTPFKFQQMGTLNPILAKAFTRYTALIFGTSQDLARAPAGCVGALTVTLQDQTGTSLSVSTDESYTLDVSSGAVNVFAQNVFGALRALETFSQLVSQTNNQFSAVGASVQDSPRFHWRGLMIDTARHYLSVNTITKLLDAMSYSKLNVLHWHLDWPNLSGAGAWNAKSVYTSQQISDIVIAAKERGIRVIPEIDMPGHAYSWGKGYPYSVANCPSYAHNINNIPLNPANDTVYSMIKSVVNVLASAYQDDYLHLGGDEVVYGCWLQDPSVQAYMKRNHIGSANDLMKEFISRVQAITATKGKSTVYWEEVFLAGTPLDPKDIIQVWKDEATLLSVAQAGVQGLLSYGWYLDHGVESDWVPFYNNEPFQSGSWSDQDQKMILGGEVAAWAERVNDFNFEQIVWPRTAAAAERLWSPRTVADKTLAQPRLMEHICRLNSRGVAAGPIVPSSCSQ